MATKDDLAHAVAELKAEIAEVDVKFDAMDAKFDALNGKFETQGRYVFLVFALIAALGLYNAIAPNFAVREPATSDTAPAVPTARGQVSGGATTVP